MDKNVLVEKDIKEGERLLRALDKADIEVRAALWFYMPENERWRFLVATPLVDEKGPKEAYAAIRKVLAQSSLGISLRQISVVSPNSDLIRLLSSAVSITPPGIRFTGNVINGVFIEDAYIYRMQ